MSDEFNTESSIDELSQKNEDDTSNLGDVEDNISYSLDEYEIIDSSEEFVPEIINIIEDSYIDEDNATEEKSYFTKLYNYITEYFRKTWNVSVIIIICAIIYLYYTYTQTAEKMQKF